MTLPALSPAHIEEVRRQARLELAAISTTDAARWRDPSIRPLAWQHDMGAVCDDIVDSALMGTGLRATLSAPPRHGKSEWVGRAMPVRAYLAAAKRDEKMPIFYVTSTDDRAREVSHRVRSAVERLHTETGDDRYAPGRIWTTTEWETEGGMSWAACGWSSSTGGIGARIVVFDDVIGTSQVYRSPAKLQSIRRVIQEDGLSRLMYGGAAVQMETRRGVRDTTAWLGEEYGDVWRPHVWRCHDPDRGYLWPGVYGERWRATMPHLSDSSPIWRALYQQEPIPEGGTLIEHDWLTATYPEPPEAARVRADRVVIGCDLTATGKTTGDPAAFVVVAVRGAHRDILHVVERRCGYVEQRAILRDLCATWRPDVVIVERAAGGDAMVDELAREVPGLRGESATRDKVTRLTPHLGRFAARQIRTPSAGARWVGPWREELAAFSGTPGELDNQVDATVWALMGAETGARVDVGAARSALRAVFGG